MDSRRLSDCPNCGHDWHPSGAAGSCPVIWMGGRCGCRRMSRPKLKPAVPIGPNPETRCCGAIVDDTGPAWTLCHRPFDHTGPHSDEWPRR